VTTTICPLAAKIEPLNAFPKIHAVFKGIYSFKNTYLNPSRIHFHELALTQAWENWPHFVPISQAQTSSDKDSLRIADSKKVIPGGYNQSDLWM
jgi:hypothetical protein